MPWNDGIKSYLRTTLIILDAPPNKSKPAGDSFEDKHYWNCRQIRNLFTEKSDAEIVWIHLPKGSGKKDLLRIIDENLEDKTEDDLVILYFEGIAYGENDEYYWDFRTGPSRIKAYNLLEKFYNTPAHCMLLLDCHTHDRLKNKLLRHDEGNTEIITTATQHKDRSGKMGYSLGQDFSDGILKRIRAYVDDLVEQQEKDEEAEEKGRPRKKKRYALRTLPQLLGKVREMYSNSNRPGYRRTKAGSDEVILRFVVDPNLIKQTGKFEFFAKLLQGEVDQGEGTAADEQETADGVAEKETCAGKAAGKGEDPLFVQDEDQDEGLADMSTIIGDKGTPDLPGTNPT